MLFSLEILQAHQGDCLLLHYGPEDQPSIILIDGGPGRYYNTYINSLEPRLEEIQQNLSPDDPVSLSMAMVSHMDDDHADGIVKLLEDMDSRIEDEEDPLLIVSNLWFNTFDDIIGNLEISGIAQLPAGASPSDIHDFIPSLARAEDHAAMMIASTRQGRDIRDLARKLSIPVNHQFDKIEAGKPKLVRTGEQGKTTLWPGDLTIQVLHPNEERLLEMQKKWDADLKKAEANGDPNIFYASLASRDKSPFNLASIVCLVEFEEKRILLTGDARDDDILQGLENAGLLDDNGEIMLDILKLPHHGSDRNVSRHFFEKVKATNYVISADGRHHNPDRSTLEMLSKATRGRDNFTIHLSNRTGVNDLERELTEFIDADRQKGRSYGFEFREDTKLSKTIDLLEALHY